MALIGTDAQDIIPPIDRAVLKSESLLVALGDHTSDVGLRPGMLGEPRVGAGQYVLQDDVPIGRHVETNGWCRMTEGPAQGVGQRLVAAAMSAAAPANFSAAAFSTALLSLSSRLGPFGGRFL